MSEVFRGEAAQERRQFAAAPVDAPELPFQIPGNPKGDRLVLWLFGGALGVLHHELKTT